MHRFGLLGSSLTSNYYIHPPTSSLLSPMDIQASGSTRHLDHRHLSVCFELPHSSELHFQKSSSAAGLAPLAKKK